jgi:hypothetical protein
MNQTTRSPEEIERMASRQRAGVRETAEEIKHRFSPETLMDNALDYMRGTGGTRMAAAIRENPLAAVMAGIGIGWLYYTMQRQEERSDRLHAAAGVDSRLSTADYGTQEDSLAPIGSPETRIAHEDRLRNEGGSAAVLKH